ncbi:MAG: PIN domain nuclease [Frankiaceae bacterium]
MEVRQGRRSSGWVELFRFLVVLFAAGVGYEIAAAIAGPEPVLGPFNGVAVGVVIGCGLGYSLGGVLARHTVVAVDQVETRLSDVSAETLVAGGVGLAAGVFIGAAVSWPLLLLPDPMLSVPLFCFLIAMVGLIGQRLAVGRRDSIVHMVGPHAGISPRTPAASALPRILDTSVAVDGRIVEVVRAGFLHGRLLVPTAVLRELQRLSDSSEDTRRHRGRRGLTTLETLKREPGVEVEVLDRDVLEPAEVDAKLVRLCQEGLYALLTLDTNLARVAGLAGVAVLNLHALGLALRPPVNAGDHVDLLLLRPGKEAGQAVGYLDDGTMVVVERGREHIGTTLPVRVASVLITANGRLVFADLAGGEPGGAGAGRSGTGERAPLPRARPVPRPPSGSRPVGETTARPGKPNAVAAQKPRPAPDQAASQGSIGECADA